jgi:hypothetical protein
MVGSYLFFFTSRSNVFVQVVGQNFTRSCEVVLEVELPPTQLQAIVPLLCLGSPGLGWCRVALINRGRFYLEVSEISFGYRSDILLRLYILAGLRSGPVVFGETVRLWLRRQFRSIQICGYQLRHNIERARYCRSS